MRPFEGALIVLLFDALFMAAFVALVSLDRAMWRRVRRAIWRRTTGEDGPPEPPARD